VAAEGGNAMLPLRIRRYRRSDIPRLKRLYRAAWADTYGPVDGADAVAVMTAGLLEGGDPVMFRLAGDDIALVAVQGWRIVGSIRAHRREGIAYLSGMYVLPGRQRSGIGSRLMAAVMAELPPGLQIVADVRPTSASAIAFYRRHGFVESGRGREDVGSGHVVDVIYMCREGAAAVSA
jgi:ribosomal protein S18 acetylase RimI-like enzyme